LYVAIDATSLPTHDDDDGMETVDRVDDRETQPSLVAVVVGHFLVGFVVLLVTKSLFRQKFVVAVVAALLALAAHHNFDAPVARKLSELGL
jgi:hypothetical protein